MNVIIEDKIKYETKNPISKYLLKNFTFALKNIMGSISFNNIYEAGCGNGYITKFMKKNHPHIPITAIDIEDGKILEAKKQVPDVNFSVGSIYETHQLDDSFDLVVSTEVLEHLDNPQKALEELVRISKRYIIISIPNEPVWCIGNMVRFKYWRYLGNTPGHIQHWNKKSIKALAERYCNISVIRMPFPWIMILLEKRN